MVRRRLSKRSGLQRRRALWLGRRGRGPAAGDGSAEDVRMMRRALVLARRAGRLGEVPVGAVVVHEGRVIGAGRNTREADADPLGHAELAAIRAAAARLGDWRLNDCTLYVTLEPCPMCAGAIVNARVGRLVYGAADPKMGAVHTLYQICTDRRLNHRVAVRAGLLAAESADLLRRFFRQRRRR